MMKYIISSIYTEILVQYHSKATDTRQTLKPTTSSLKSDDKPRKLKKPSCSKKIILFYI